MLSYHNNCPQNTLSQTRGERLKNDDETALHQALSAFMRNRGDMESGR